jgi:hypothetical protein
MTKETERPKLMVSFQRRGGQIYIQDWTRSDLPGFELYRNTTADLSGSLYAFGVYLDELPHNLGVLDMEAVLHELACWLFNTVENPYARERVERVKELLYPETMDDLVRKVKWDGSVSLCVAYLSRYGSIEDAKRAAAEAGFTGDDPQWEAALKMILSGSEPDAAPN